MTRRACWFPIALAAAAASILPLNAFAQPQVAPHNLTIYWNVHTDRNELLWGSKQDWANQLQLGGVPINKQVIILYEHLFGIFPKEGPHMFYTNPNLMADHIRKIREHVQIEIPDVDFSGIVVIDYESWNAMWDITDASVKQRWKTYLESKSPNPLHGLTGVDEQNVLRTTYEAATKRFYEVTIDELKRLRPRVKVGLYDYPTAYAQSDDVYNKPGPSIYKSRNDRLQWLWNKLDVMTPSIYAWRATVQNPSPTRRFDCSAEEQRLFIRGLISETERISQGKPIYAYYWCKYGSSSGPQFDGKFHTDLGLATAFDELKRTTADGVIFWDVLGNQDAKEKFQSFITAKLVPQLRTVTPSSQGGGSTPAPTPPPPPAPPPAGGSGSGGGTDGGSGDLTTQPRLGQQAQPAKRKLQVTGFLGIRPSVKPVNSGNTPPAPSGSGGSGGSSGSGSSGATSQPRLALTITQRFIKKYGNLSPGSPNRTRGVVDGMTKQAREDDSN